VHFSFINIVVAVAVLFLLLVFSLSYPNKAVLHLLDTLWVLEAQDHGSLSCPCFMAGNPQDTVVNFRVKATNVFLRFGDVPRALYCVTNAEHHHVIAGDILSPSTVVPLADAALVFLKAHLDLDLPRESSASCEKYLGGPGSPRSPQSPRNLGPLPSEHQRQQHQSPGAKDKDSKERMKRARSVPSGLGGFASLASMSDLIQPFEVG
jgi:hypothetical protein